MVRKALIAGISGILLATPAAGDVAWMSSITDNGWTRMGGNEQMQILYRKAVGAPGSAFKRIWIRYEMEEPEPPASRLSSAGLYEVDCVEMRYRTLSWTDYTQRNLSGQTLPDRGSPVWQFPIPATMADAATRMACGMAPPTK